MPGSSLDTARRPSTAPTPATASPQYGSAPSESDRVIIFCGCDAELLSFSCWPDSNNKRAAAHHAPPPLALARPAVVSAWGPLLITSRVGGELACLEIGSFAHPLLPRARVWRTSTLEFTFRQPAPNKFWTVKLPGDIPPALLRRLCSMLDSVCNFNTCCEPEEDTSTPAQIAADDAALEEAFAAQRLAGAGADGPTPLVLDAVQRISQRTLPVSAAHKAYTREPVPASGHSLRQVRKLNSNAWINDIAKDDPKDTRNEATLNGSTMAKATISETSKVAEPNTSGPKLVDEDVASHSDDLMTPSYIDFSSSFNELIQPPQEPEPASNITAIMTPIDSPKKLVYADSKLGEREAPQDLELPIASAFQPWASPGQANSSQVESEDWKVQSELEEPTSNQPSLFFEPVKRDLSAGPEPRETIDLESITNLDLTSAGTIYSQMEDHVETRTEHEESETKLDLNISDESSEVFERLSSSSPSSGSQTPEIAEDANSTPEGEVTPSSQTLLPSLIDPTADFAFVPSPILAPTTMADNAATYGDLKILRGRRSRYLDDAACFEPTPEPMTPLARGSSKLNEPHNLFMPRENVQTFDLGLSTPTTPRAEFPRTSAPPAVSAADESVGSLEVILETLEIQRKRQNDESKEPSSFSVSTPNRAEPRRSVSDQVSRLIQVAASTVSDVTANVATDLPTRRERAGSAPCSPVRKTLSAAVAAETLKKQHRAISLQLRPPWQAAKSSLIPRTSIRFTNPLVPLNSRSTVHCARPEDAVQLSPSRVVVQDVTTISGYISWQSMERYMNAFQ